MSKTTKIFFQIAIWVPAALFLPLPVMEHFFRGPQSFEDMFLTYGLSFGILAYPAFAIWTTWHIRKKSETDIAKLIWWAPIIFIPFYGAPWILYGLSNIVMGEMSGISMALLWVAFTPYILIVGYSFSAATFFIYKTLFQPTNAD